MTALANRYDFVLLFDVSKGNPNGDPGRGQLAAARPRNQSRPGFGRQPEAQSAQLCRVRQKRHRRFQHLRSGRRDPERAAPQGLSR